MRETIGPLPAWNWWLVERDRQVQIITYIKYFQQVRRALKKIKQESDRVTEGPGATLDEAINLPTRSGNEPQRERIGAEPGHRRASHEAVQGRDVQGDAWQRQNPATGTCLAFSRNGEKAKVAGVLIKNLGKTSYASKGCEPGRGDEGIFCPRADTSSLSVS